MSKTVTILWCVLSFIVSGLFIFHGLMLFQLGELPTMVFFSAVVALIYGITTIYLLVISWVKPNIKYVTTSKYVVVLMFFTQLLQNLDVGMISGLEWAALLLVAIMLSTNWLSVKYVIKYKN